MNKKLLIAVAVLAIGIGVIGGKAILGTTLAAKDTCQVAQTPSDSSSKNIKYTKYFFVPETAIPSNDFADSVAKIQKGENKDARLYVASNGMRFIFNLEPGATNQDEQISKLQTRVEQIVKSQVEKEAKYGRSESERAEAVKNIKQIAGADRTVKFLETLPPMNFERYSDSKGFEYFVSKATNKVVVMSAGKDFAFLNSDILDENGWKGNNITKEQANEIARKFIQEKSGLDQKTLGEVLAGLKAEDGKHGAFRFYYGENGSGVYGEGSWAFEVIVEPASGQIISYSNAFAK